MTELCDLALIYGSDKCPQIRHHFTEWYYMRFADHRTQVRKILEIGIGRPGPGNMNNPGYIQGASLRMWRDFFPQAQVYGGDCDPQTMFAEERIQTRLCDQRNIDQLYSLIDWCGTDLDLVIDDASHRPRWQIFTCQTLMPILSDKTVYVIEDVSRPEIADHLGQYSPRIWRPRHKGSHDDRLLIIDREAK